MRVKYIGFTFPCQGKKRGSTPLTRSRVKLGSQEQSLRGAKSDLALQLYLYTKIKSKTFYLIFS